jgi:hypothetical protein
MTTHQFSRRRLLGGFLAALTAWLCPRPRGPAASRRPTPSLLLPPDNFVYTCTYSYDSRGHLVRVTKHPPRPSAPIRCTHVRHQHGDTYTYYLG